MPDLVTYSTAELARLVEISGLPRAICARWVRGDIVPTEVHFRLCGADMERTREGHQ